MVYIKTNTYLGHSHNDSQDDDKYHVHAREHGQQECGNDSNEHAQTKHVLPAKSLCQQAPRYLCDDVAIEEGTEYITLEYLVPHKFTLPIDRVPYFINTIPLHKMVDNSSKIVHSYRQPLPCSSVHKYIWERH